MAVVMRVMGVDCYLSNQLCTLQLQKRMGRLVDRPFRPRDRDTSMGEHTGRVHGTMEEGYRGRVCKRGGVVWEGHTRGMG